IVSSHIDFVLSQRWVNQTAADNGWKIKSCSGLQVDEIEWRLAKGVAIFRHEQAAEIGNTPGVRPFNVRAHPPTGPVASRWQRDVAAVKHKLFNQGYQRADVFVELVHVGHDTGIVLPIIHCLISPARRHWSS